MRALLTYFSLATTLLSLLLRVSVARGAEENTVDTILERHVAAMGGEAAVQGLTSLRFQLLIEELTFTVRGDYRATAEGLMRIDVYDGDARVFSEGIDARGAWQQGGEGAEIEAVSPSGLQALQRGIDQNLFGLYDLESRGHRAANLGREEHEGVRYHRLRVTLADGFERDYLLHPRTWMIDYVRETSALHPDIDPTARPVESFNLEFFEVCGLARAQTTHTIDMASRERIQRTTITGAECNLSNAALELDRPVQNP